MLVWKTVVCPKADLYSGRNGYTANAQGSGRRAAEDKLALIFAGCKTGMGTKNLILDFRQGAWKRFRFPVLPAIVARYNRYASTSSNKE